MKYISFLSANRRMISKPRKVKAVNSNVFEWKSLWKQIPKIKNGIKKGLIYQAISS
jgi:hypothetical protein